MAGTIVIDRIESDGGYASSVNVASTMNFSQPFTMGNVGIPLGGKRNHIINGAMQISQRNVSTAVTSTVDNADSGVYLTVDRFKMNSRFASVIEQQDNDVPTGQGFTYSKKVTVNTVSSNTTHNYAETSYEMEGYDVLNTGWVPTSSDSYATLSFWAKSSLAGTYAVQIRATGSGAKVITKYYTLASNTWTKVTFTFSGVSGISPNDFKSTSSRLRILFSFDGGTAFSDNSSPEGTWFTVTNESDFFKDYPQRFLSTAGATFHMTGVQFEFGKVATPFEFVSFQEDLTRCMRYFQKSRPYATGARASYGFGFPFDSQGYQNCLIASDDGAAGFSVEFPVEMRTSPTVYSVHANGTISTAAAFNTYNGSGSGAGINYGFGPVSSAKRIVSYTEGTVNRAEEICWVYYTDAEI
jgi:hypothetical protein